MARFSRRTGRACLVALAILAGASTGGASSATPALASGAAPAEAAPGSLCSLLVPRRTRLIINYRRSVLA